MREDDESIYHTTILREVDPSYRISLVEGTIISRTTAIPIQREDNRCTKSLADCVVLVGEEDDPTTLLFSREDDSYRISLVEGDEF